MEQGSFIGQSYWASQPDGNRGFGINFLPDPTTDVGFAWRVPYTENGVGKFLYMRVEENRQKSYLILLSNVLVKEPTAANYPNLVGTWQPVLEPRTGFWKLKYVKRFAKINSVGGPTYINSPETSIENLTTGNYKEPDLLGLYFITDNSSITNGKVPTRAILMILKEYDVSEEDIVEFTFINVFDVGQDLDLQPIKSIETTNVKMLEHHGRLLIYDKKHNVV